MLSTDVYIKKYLHFCIAQTRLDKKTIRAYSIDLQQFYCFINHTELSTISHDLLEKYVANLHSLYKVKTVKRKIASIKAFFHYCEYHKILSSNPFDKLHIRFKEPVVLPKTISLHSIELLLNTIYLQCTSASTLYKRKNALRDVAVIELLFATGMRISELCNLMPSDINFYDNVVSIYGKGSKERKIHIGNNSVINVLNKYKLSYSNEILKSNYFFVNQSGTPISDQSVRRMINRYVVIADLEQHITPHMFRHTFASTLLDADVDIRYIQEMLGHSSIKTTQIYTHVTLAKQKDILTTKHPRNSIHTIQ